MNESSNTSLISRKLKEENGTVAGKLGLLDFLLGLTAGGDRTMKTFYESADDIIVPVIDLMHHSDQAVAEIAVKILMNLSAQSEGAEILATLQLSPPPKTLVPDSSNNIFSRLLDHILVEDSPITEFAVSTLINMSQNEAMAKKVYECFPNEEVINKIINLALSCNQKYNLLPSLLSNLTQLSEVRGILLRESNRDILGEFLTLTDSENEDKRRGVVGTIRNLCLSIENHEFLLDPKLNLIARILLPLAGPEEFHDKVSKKLPLDLQYLPEDKTREPVATIRKMLLEIIMQLCAAKSARVKVRKLKTKYILLEYYQWETNEECDETCLHLLNTLIRKENQIGVDNLKNVEIPSDIIEKLNQLKVQPKKEGTQLNNYFVTSFEQLM